MKIQPNQIKYFFMITKKCYFSLIYMYIKLVGKFHKKRKIEKIIIQIYFNKYHLI